jgi:hypothetical protein
MDMGGLLICGGRRLIDEEAMTEKKIYAKEE